MIRSRVLPVVALAAGLCLAGAGAAQPPKGVPVGQPSNLVPVGQPPKGVMVGGQTTPGAIVTEVPLVPKSAAAFLSIKVADLVDHPDMKAVLEQLKKSPEALDGITELIGLTPQEIERVTFFWPTLGSRGPGAPVVVVTTRQPYNEARISHKGFQ